MKSECKVNGDADPQARDPKFDIPRVSGFKVSHHGTVPAADAEHNDTYHEFESFNANGGKRTVKKRLEKSSAKVILMQEIGHLEADLEALDSWCATRGWSMRALSSKTTAGHNTGA
eukprot:7551885-Pyramimonas_sp.AAC.1